MLLRVPSLLPHSLFLVPEATHFCLCDRRLTDPSKLVKTWLLRYPKDFFERDLPEFDRPETAVLPLPRLYLQAKQLAKDLAEHDDLDEEVG